MAETFLYGTELARTLTEETQKRFVQYAELGEPACLTTVLVGDNPASKRYIEMKQEEGSTLGVNMDRLELPHDITQEDLEGEMEQLSASGVDSILIQYPLPPGLNYLSAVSRIKPTQDVDGLHPANLGLLFHDPENFPGLVPCTPNGILQLLEHGNVGVQNADITVVGRGLTVGGPLSVLLAATHNGASATVSTVHLGTKELRAHTRDADIVIGAAGSPGLIDADAVKEGAALISVGVKYEAGKARGDFTPAAKAKAGVYVPVTNGVGPMTRANLWANVARCHELRHRD